MYLEHSQEILKVVLKVFQFEGQVNGTFAWELEQIETTVYQQKQYLFSKVWGTEYKTYINLYNRHYHMKNSINSVFLRHNMEGMYQDLLAEIRAWLIPRHPVQKFIVRITCALCLHEHCRLYRFSNNLQRIILLRLFEVFKDCLVITKSTKINN